MPTASASLDMNLAGRRWTVALWSFFALTLLLRLIAMAMVPLIPEEAYYWMYAHHTEWAYFDHPPMVGWTIAVGVALFGDTEFGVRFGAHLLAWGAGVLMYYLGAAWFGRKAGLVSAVALHVLPVYFGLGLIATMDSALLFFWLAALLGMTAALRRGEASGWYVFGAMAGLAFLTKYTAVFLAAGAVVALVGRREWRGQLRSAHPYLSMLLAAAVAMPVILWNAQNHWASFRFQFVDRYADDTLNLRSVGVFWLMQLATLTPMLLVGLVLMLWRAWRQRRRLSAGHWFALSFFAPATAVVLLKSLKSEIHINWMAPIYLSVLPMLAHAGLARLRLERRRFQLWRWRPGLALTTLLCMTINGGMLAYLLALQPSLRWWEAFGPWEPIARVVEEYEDTLEEQTGREPLVIADGKYRLASVLAFYRPRFERHTNEDGTEGHHFTTSQWVLQGRGLGYEFWLHREALVGSNAIYVTDDKQFLPQITPWFESVESVHDPRLNDGGRHFSLAVCRGLRAESKDRSLRAAVLPLW